MMESLKAFSLTYISSPYSNYEGGIEAAYVEICKIMARLMLAGVRAYSPIAMTHGIAIHGDINPLSHSLWLPFDSSIMAKADAICVAMMPSWEISYGIRHEIEVFTKAGKPVFYLNPETMRVESVSQEFWTGREGE